MQRVWAVARHMMAESIRQKIALVGVVLIGLMLAVVPVVVEGDGLTLTSRVQSFLAYTLGGISAVLSVVTVFLACLAISDEIYNRRIFMIASKPIPRWQFFVGKWLGISLLNAALLGLCLVAILAATWGLGQVATQVPGDKEELEFEVLSARHSLTPAVPDFDPLIEARIRRMREEGRFDQVGPGTELNVREQIRNELKNSWRSIPPGEGRVFKFEGLLVDREEEDYLHIRFKPVHPGGLSDALALLGFRCGDPENPDTLTRDMVDNYLVERFHTLPVPSYAVNDEGTLYVTIFNLDPLNSYTFEGADGLELLHDMGTFHWNLFRAFVIIWSRLAFLAAVGLLLSTFLSFPVAAMGCFLVLFVAAAAGWLEGSIDWVGPKSIDNDPLWILGPLVRPLAAAFVWLVPNFSDYDAADNIVNGRLVTLMWVLKTFVTLVVIKGGIIGLIGCIVLTRRELAGET